MDPFSSDESEDPLLADASDPELMSEADSDFDPNEGGSRRRPRSTEPSERSDSSEESDDSDNSDQIDYADDSDGAEVDDMEIARRLDREMNGLRGRPRRASVLNVSHPEPSRPKRRKTGGGRAIKLKVKLSTKRGARRIVESSSEEEEDNEYYIPRHGRQTRANNFTSGRKKVNYKENDENDEDLYEEEEIELLRETRKQASKEVSAPKIPALMSASECLDSDDYDIERVVDHKWEADEFADEGEELGGPTSCRGRSYKFRIKWQRRAYIYCTWEHDEDLRLLNGYKRVTNYLRKVNWNEDRRPYLSPEEIEQENVEKEMELQLVHQHMEIDRIVDEQDSEVHGLCYLIKWNGLPYSDCTWETADVIERCSAHAILDRFQIYQQRGRESGSAVEAQRSKLLQQLRRQGGKLFTSQPSYVTGTLRAYQLDGLNYLAACWARNSNCILADEMGLGKTIQCVTMLNFLFEQVNLTGPFLVVVPLSTLPNWKKEFNIWAPNLNTVVYIGDGNSREVVRSYEVYNSGKGRRYKMNVLLTTYEVVLKDSAFLRSIQWVYLMVDEAHRLKNNESSLYKDLSSFHCKTRLLVTGTPLQNNVKELWALLHFLHPKNFGSLEDFQESHDMNEEEGLKNLHKDLMPHLLRRTIKDVEKSLPPKTERILRVEMSPLQKKYYRLILKRNFSELNKGVKGSGHVSLLNIVMELKKCCNHPFLFESAEEQHFNVNDSASKLLTLVLASGKLSLLDKLLQRLKEAGHRVLIFSQMVRMLTILSDYCKLKGYRFQQLDGSTNAQARHQAMEHFNAPGSEDFIFLLSTRAGGLGINLATADTVVIFDSDWNPQNDLQAMSRAHRIGQKDAVNIYRFVTAASVEEDILERAKQKMVLDQLVIQQMDTSGRTILNSSKKTAKKMFNKDDLAAILKFGAEDLFKDEKEDKSLGPKDPSEAGEASKSNMTDLDAILARAEHVEDKKGSGGASDFLSSFKVADIKTSAGEDDKTFWERLIPEQERPQKVEEAELYLPRAARMAAPSSYAEHELLSMKNAGNDASEARRTKSKAAKKTKQSTSSSGKMREVKNAVHSLVKWDGGPTGFGQNEAKAFLQSIRRFHDHAKVLQDAADEAPFFANLTADHIRQLQDLLVEGLDATLREHQRLRTQEAQEAPEASPPKAEAEAARGQPSSRPGWLPASPNHPPKDKDPTLGFFGNAARCKDTKNRLEELRLVHDNVSMHDDPMKFRIGGAKLPRAPVWARKCGWSPRDDAMVLVGVYKHGWGSWEKVLGDETLGIGNKVRASVEANTKNTPESHLQLRANSLMRRLREVSAGTRPVRAPRPSAAARRAQSGPPRPPKSSKSRGLGPARTGAGVPELMADIKATLAKVKSLQNGSKDVKPEVKVQKMKLYLSRVGKFIQGVAKDKGLGKKEEERLWQYAAKKSHLQQDGTKMKAIYQRLSQAEEKA